MIDLYGGSVEIFFKTAQGQTVSLASLFNSGTTGAPSQTNEFITSVSVKLTLLRFLEVNVTISPTFEKAVQLLQNKNSPIGLGFSGSFPSGETASKDPNVASEAFSKFSFNKMSVRLHYGGKNSNFFTTVLMVPEISIGTDGITIKIKGVGLLFPQTQKSLNKAIEQSNRLELIKRYLEPNSNIITQPDDSALNEALAKFETIVASGSNHEELKKILLKCNAYIHEVGTPSKDDPHTYEIISKSYMSSRDGGGYRFVLWNQINPNKGVYPILDMETSIANYMAGQMIKQVTAYDSSKKENSKNPSTPKTTPSKTNQKLASPDGSGVGVNLEGDEKIKKVHVPNRGNGFGTSMVEAFEGVFNTLTDKALQYEITTVGIVDLKPGISVFVDVAGVDFLSGKYDLFEVTHDFASDGVTTKLTLSRTFGFAKLIDNGVEQLQQKISPNQTAAPTNTNAKVVNVLE